jgi:mannose-1-phosphate guanylyltransferase
VPFRRHRPRAKIAHAAGGLLNQRNCVRHRLNTWALVLAGGEGSRLHGLTKNVHGAIVPKQFCSLQGGPSLLQEALQRAASVAPMQRVCTVVAAQHRQWWTSMLNYLPRDNVIVQPHNRGTAHGILLPLIRIAERDPDAVVVLLPADHYLRDEDVMSASLRRAAQEAHAQLDAIVLLGIEPDEADTELGYILPASTSREQPAAVLRFIEKPSDARARALLADGALWNSFIMAGSVRALLRLYDVSFKATVAAMRTLDDAALARFYEHLASVDFSRDVLQGNEAVLKVLGVPSCGWTDLGTPRRIGATLRRLEDDAIGPALRPYSPHHLNLADQYSRLQGGRSDTARFGHVDLHA